MWHTLQLVVMRIILHLLITNNIIILLLRWENKGKQEWGSFSSRFQSGFSDIFLFFSFYIPLRFPPNIIKINIVYFSAIPYWAGYPEGINRGEWKRDLTIKLERFSCLYWTSSTDGATQNMNEIRRLSFFLIADPLIKIILTFIDSFSDRFH